MRGRSLRIAAVAGVALTAAFLLLPNAPAPGPFHAGGPALPFPSRFSFFALGDTGQPERLPSLFSGQLSVARALTAHDVASPVDAVLLLGDLFYPEGIARSELTHRVAEHLVRPYCRFAALDADRSAEVAAACDLPEALHRERPPRLVSVLGNHDYGVEESPRLQRDAVPQFVSNWRVADAPVELWEPVPGLSFILVDTPTLHRTGRTRAITRALRESRGPWRVLVSHHPAATPVGREKPPRLQRSVERSGVHVQLFIAGHHHNLQVVEMADPRPALQLISGGGSTRRPIEADFAGRRFGKAATGFARVDLVAGDHGEERLRVSLHEAPRYPAVFWWVSSHLGTWEIALDGATRRLADAGKQPARSIRALARVDAARQRQARPTR